MVNKLHIELGTRSLQECIHITCRSAYSFFFFCHLYKTLSHHEFEVQHCSSPQQQLVSSSVGLEALHPALMALPSKNEVHSTVFFSVCVCGVGGAAPRKASSPRFSSFPYHVQFNHVPIIFDSSHPFFAYWCLKVLDAYWLKFPETVGHHKPKHDERFRVWFPGSYRATVFLHPWWWEETPCAGFQAEVRF